MGEAALSWGSQFERVEARRGPSKELRLAGLLAPVHDLEEVTLSPAATRQGVGARRRAVRAFLVRTDRLSDSGLRPGDHVLVEATRDWFADPLVLARTGSQYRLDAASRLHQLYREIEILGVFVGIIRKQGFATTKAPSAGRDLSGPRTRDDLLRGRLEMLEATCASTRHPRLRRALKIEADAVRRQLQTGASSN